MNCSTKGSLLKGQANKPMRKIFYSLIIITVSVHAAAQDLKYATKNIPAALRKDANSVLREETEQFTVKDAGSALYNDHCAITILNSKAKHYLTFADHTDKFDRLTDASITIYDSTGMKLKTYTMKDMSADNYGGEFVDDGKYYSYAVTPTVYPITIEINYTEKFTGILGYPTGNIQGENQSVENYAMQVTVPKNVGMHYKVLNIQDNCIKTDNVTSIAYTWNIKNLNAKKIDDNSGPGYLYLPKIILAPNRFKMDDYAGDMSTWQSFGKWYGELIGTTRTLSPAEQTFFQNMVKDKTTDKEKAETIYRYLQNNMRYVSIQLGIGGWKPFAASFVDTKKYGDCKALVNYMQAALSAVGIKSYPVINHYGTLSLPIEKDFPVNAFNHAILCIPQPKDSIWLECTSTVSGVICGFGELYAETKDHPALMVTENGGELVRTPASKAGDNTTVSKNIVDLNNDGSAQVHAAVCVTGEMKYPAYHYLYNASDEDKREFIFDGMKFKQSDSLTIDPGDKFDDPFRFDLQLKYSQLPDFTISSKLFIGSRLQRIYNEDIPTDTARKQDYYFDYPYCKTDTTELHYPQGFQVEGLPQNKRFETPYTSYASNYLLDSANRTIRIITRFSVLKTIVKAADYGKLSGFAADVQDDLDEKIVLNRTED